jgi:hypothetical protein
VRFIIGRPRRCKPGDPVLHLPTKMLAHFRDERVRGNGRDRAPAAGRGGCPALGAAMGFDAHALATLAAGLKTRSDTWMGGEYLPDKHLSGQVKRAIRSMNHWGAHAANVAKVPPG